ncbi:hypothetical protein P6U16_01880 [Rhizobium sp. 32-5/1]|uniref:hypothetical protein n=1 Tax=Rhizobium sp. 32-5/1 TaxID=3019602 RepID=UPI00240D2CDB|nr:hypothetical protein [Rhizobium sp. 32-5/1]WEZ83604.1 hypothetical protein P6U16_01880 [Rhizobium sp. 32-5/1]
MSWSFARALEGAGDRDGDGKISRLELEDYVFSNVKNQSEALQVPNFTPQVPRSESEVVVSLTRSVVQPVPDDQGTQAEVVIDNAAAPVNDATDADMGAKTNTDPGNALKSARDLGWTDKLALSVSGSSAEITNIGGTGVPYRWDAASGNFYTPNGDIAGQNITDTKVQGVVDKFVLLDFLKALASQKAGTVSLTPVKELYRSGDRLTFEAPASGYTSRIIFNLANTGEVQLIEVQSAGSEDEFKLPNLEVVEPFGADHLVVIATNEPVDAIAAVLANPEIDAAALLKVLQTRIDATDSSIAIQPLYTQEKP